MCGSTKHCSNGHLRPAIALVVSGTAIMEQPIIVKRNKVRYKRFGASVGAAWLHRPRVAVALQNDISSEQRTIGQGDRAVIIEAERSNPGLGHFGQR